MNNWEKSFSKNILSRGFAYYKEGKVENLTHNGKEFTAEVWGGDIYEVSFKMPENGKVYLSCECPYAAKGYKCKHMAALLYEIEAKGLMPQIKPAPKPTAPSPLKKTSPVSSLPPLTPFAGTTSAKNTYFSLSDFGNMLTVTPELYMKARSLISGKKFSLSSIETDYLRSHQEKGKHIIAHGVCRDANVRTELIFSRKKIFSFYCNCSFNYQYSTYRFMAYEGTVKMCEHMTALGLLTNDYINENNPGDATDIDGEKFLGFFRESEKNDIFSLDEEAVQIHLLPRLETVYDSALSLSFRIGDRKVYVLKNMNDLVQAVENKAVLQLTQNYSIDFSNSVFDEKSRQFYDFIHQHINDMYAGEDELYDSPVKNVQSIRLVGSLLDSFYDIASDEEVEYTGSSIFKTKETLVFGTGKPQITLNLENLYNSENGWFEGVTLSGILPELLKGAKYNYFVENNTLYRIDAENYRRIQPFYKAALYNNFRINIGQRNLSEFYYSVLPDIRKNAKVIEHEGVNNEEILPPEIELRFFLDLEDNIPICKPCAFYGDAEYDLTNTTSSDITAYRNSYKEKLALDTVKQYFPSKSENGFLGEGDEEAIFNILQNGIRHFMELGEVHTTSRFDSLKVQRKMKITVGVSIQSNLMDLKIDTDDIPHSELIDILNSYKLKKRYHRLKSGEFVSLDEGVEELYNLTQTLHISSKEFLKENIQVPAYRALYLDKMLGKYDNIYAERDRQFRKFIKEFKTVSESDFEVPFSLKKIMRDYQKFGHKWIRTVSASGFGGILADDMGLGKTLQMISVIAAQKEENKGETALIICPASLVYNWLEEFGKYAPELSVCPVVGTAAERKELIENCQNFDVVITSYDLLKRDIAEYENITFGYQVIDEAQNIKNHSTASSKSVKIINAKMRFALTGTPIENRLGELWSIFDFLMPGFLYGYDVFRKEFEIPIVKGDDAQTKEKLKNMVSPFILRRLKKDVLKDLPDKLEEIRYAKFDKQQQHVYDAQALNMINMLSGKDDESFRKDKIQILAELTKIRRICCDPSLVFENYDGESAKKEACLDLVESAIEAGHKILLFSQFVSMLEILEKEFEKRNIKYYKITGDTDKKERVELVSRFNSDDTPLFLISLKAGGTGLNLTGADVVIHYDPWWNVAAQNQATDRAHRIGQKKVVSVYKLIAKNTIEEKISELQKAKQALADAVIGESNTAFSSFSKEDIIKIIGL